METIGGRISQPQQHYEDICVRPDRVAAVIQWWDRDWFLERIEENRPPPRVQLEPEPQLPE